MKPHLPFPTTSMSRQEALFPEVTPSSEVHSAHLEVDALALGSFQAKVQQEGWVPHMVTFSTSSLLLLVK